MSDVIDLPLPGLPGLLRMTFRQVKAHELGFPEIEESMTVQEDHLSPTRYLHAGVVVALADTACGYGCLASLPSGKTGFTTIELKSNHLGTAEPGQRLQVRTRAAHRGRTTQVWDATVVAGFPSDPFPAKVAIFRCTQLLLDPKPTNLEGC